MVDDDDYLVFHKEKLRIIIVLMFSLFCQLNYLLLIQNKTNVKLMNKTSASVQIEPNSHVWTDAISGVTESRTSR